ncbi:MAG: hypothetical protein ACYTG0_33430 [Planctomycetota bacterium]|jgi:hypothetical protein
MNTCKCDRGLSVLICLPCRKAARERVLKRRITRRLMTELLRRNRRRLP